MIEISKDERSRLDAQSDLKDRTNLSLEMMEKRLAAAEKLTTRADFDAMQSELGAFHALVDDSVGFLNKRGGSKTLDSFKKLEMAFRRFAPRIETIRRELPMRYDDYMRKLQKFLRDARAKAVDPFFSDSVVRQRLNDQ
jgi:hypothetical protein